MCSVDESKIILTSDRYYDKRLSKKTLDYIIWKLKRLSVIQILIKTSKLCNLEANYEFKKKNFQLCNPKYYRGIFLEIRKFMEMEEEDMEVQ